MFGLQMLDVLIGLIFVYVLLALACTVAMEIIAGILDKRTRNLRLGINNLLGEVQPTMSQRVTRATSGILTKKSPEPGQPPSLVAEFYRHPLIKSLHEDGTPPSYIPPATFALTLLDMFAPATGTKPRLVADFTAGVNQRLKDYPDLRQNLLIMVDEAGNDMAVLKAKLEEMFNNSMERVAGWYKKKTQVPLLLLAISLCTLANADSIRLAKSLYNDGALRAALVAQAQVYAKEQTNATDQAATAAKLEQSVNEIRQLGLKIGWDKDDWAALGKDWDDKKGQKEWPFRLIGILLSALAVSLGAPFWFDILNQLVTIRAVGNAPAEKKITSLVQGEKKSTSPAAAG